MCCCEDEDAYYWRDLKVVGNRRKQRSRIGQVGRIVQLNTIIHHGLCAIRQTRHGAVPRDTLGDLLRALGQNPTQAEVADIVAAAPREVDYKTFLAILNRPDGFKPAGTPDEFIRGFQVFDKEGNGFIGAGELRYVLTQLGEKMSDEEVDELLKGVQIGADGNVNYESFVRTILVNEGV
ncbi:hypothetical protein BJ912DRAFT_961796 [Pholiota molesta]|nr:hypothetical protein BJ912DRAFT_961796 [Pholiota molesta]